MSEEKVEVVRGDRGGGHATGLGHLAYDAAVELDQTRMPDGGIYHGHHGLREFYGRWIRSWEDFRADPVEFIDASDEIVVMEISGTG